MLLSLLAFASCSLQPHADPPAAREEPRKLVASPEMPAPGSAVRLVGDPAIAPALDGEEYTIESLGLRIEAPLPKGYPAPTPPGMVELKTYPSVRRAEYSAKGRSTIGMNMGFWPLFNHIKKRDIAMTSPVEMDYQPQDARKPLDPMPDASSWTMSFLYRTPDLGPTEEDGRIRVIDTAQVTVISLGMLGPYGTATVNKGMGALEKWFAAQADWEPAGDPRAFNYNGPSVPGARKWSEVQVPVKRKKPAVTEGDPQPAGAAHPASAGSNAAP